MTYDSVNNIILIICKNQEVYKFYILTRKCYFQPKTNKKHFGPGCLMADDNKYLYVFSSWGGVERLSMNGP